MNDKKTKKLISVEQPTSIELDENTLDIVSGGTVVRDDVIESGLISIDDNVIVIDNHII